MRFADVRWIDETDSTNAQLLQAAREGAPDGTVLVADHQTAGRGRLGRRWESPAGASLLVSVLLRPDLPPGRAHLVTMAAGLAAARAADELTGRRPSLKWPNDLVYEDEAGTWKLAGLLSESVIDGGRLAALVVGMGLNVDVRPTEEAEAVNTYRGGPLSGDPVDRRALLDAWLRHLDTRLDDLSGVLADFRQRCSTLRRAVRIERPAGSIEGRALDVTDDGHLLVQTGDDVVDVAVGDVIHLRVTGRGQSPAGVGRRPGPSR